MILDYIKTNLIYVIYNYLFIIGRFSFTSHSGLYTEDNSAVVDRNHDLYGSKDGESEIVDTNVDYVSYGT